MLMRSLRNPKTAVGLNFEDELTASDSPEERKYRQACQIVIENQKASGSWLQRQMGVGYNTAAKWIERMESEGLVGPANHVGRREIFRDQDRQPTLDCLAIIPQERLHL